MRITPAALGLAMSLLIMVCDAGAAEVIVTTCGESIDASRVKLGGDLDCTGHGAAFSVVGSAVVNLAGFTITGGTRGISVLGRCKVFSDPPGGGFVGQTLHGIKCGAGSSRQGGARVTDVTFTGGGGAGQPAIFAEGRIKLKRVTISNWYAGVTTTGGFGVRNGIRVDDSLIDNNVTFGVSSGRGLRIRNSAITNNGDFGISTGDFGARTNVKNSVVSGNGGDGIVGGVDATTMVKESEVVGNGGIGVFGLEVAKITSSIIADNGLIGVRARHTRIKDSSVVGNGTSAECGVTIGCADLASFTSAPRLVGTSTCDTSWDGTSGIPGTSWGVCSLD